MSVCPPEPKSFGGLAGLIIPPLVPAFPYSSRATDFFSVGRRRGKATPNWQFSEWIGCRTALAAARRCRDWNVDANGECHNLPLCLFSVLIPYVAYFVKSFVLIVTPDRSPDRNRDKIMSEPDKSDTRQIMPPRTKRTPLCNRVSVCPVGGWPDKNLSGVVVVFDSQEFRCIGYVPHRKADGTETTLLGWDTECPSCGVTFGLKTTVVFRRPRRRCDACKAPGKRAFVAVASQVAA
jgi:hypothetical protein